MTDNEEKIKMLEYYKNKLAYMVSDVDFKNVLKDDPKVIQYSQLINYEDFYQLLPKEKDYVIVLTEFKPNTGHWCVLTRDGNYFYWFDSYGVKPDGENKFIPLIMRKFLGENDKDLTRLIKATERKGGKVEWNKKKYQVLRDGISTCGKWCIVFIQMFQLGNNPEDFRRVFKKLKGGNNNKPYDILLVEMI